MTESGERLETVSITNDRDRLREVMAWAGETAREYRDGTVAALWLDNPSAASENVGGVTVSA